MLRFYPNSKNLCNTSIICRGARPCAPTLSVPFFFQIGFISKRAAGIEPALIAWKAIVLPLNYARKFPTFTL